MLDINTETLAITGASSIVSTEVVQTLWSGYGEIKRYVLADGKYASVIVKHIQLPDQSKHPRGWNTPLSHQRKLNSYQVERKWYQQYASQTDAFCKVPKSYHAVEKDAELLLIMEDLDASGFSIRMSPEEMTLDHAKNCLRWLAHFHAKFMGVEPNGLWPIGTYWHLDTRPDELEKMGNKPLKAAAKGIDARLNDATYQTLVHGDAKLANFCFAANGDVAAVDFQYVGRGCGMKDVAYFISSCFDEEDCEKYENELLSSYFNQLQKALDNNTVYQQVNEEWIELYRYAWADFYRFLDGWGPGHWKMHDYSKNITQRVIDELK
uniref:phosphotransferase n=1 Tax=Fulvivirga sp. TaxID=1931237 RepID=UPI00404A05E0